MKKRRRQVNKAKEQRAKNKEQSKKDSKACLARTFLAFIIFHFSLFICHAQTAVSEIETLLGTNTVTYAQAARFVLDASDTMITSDPYEAFLYAKERNWLPKNASPDGSARLDEVSLLLMCSFNLNGGMLYSFTPNPRYAYRELTYNSIIQGRSDPAMNVSGEMLLFIVGRILDGQDEETAIAAEKERRRIVAEELARKKKAEEERIAEELARKKAEEEERAAEKERQRNLAIGLVRQNVQFLPDSAELLESEQLRLQKLANILKNIPGIKIQAEGHTARVGTPESCFELSDERAQAVASYLILLEALKESDVTVVGHGAEKPIADNSSAAGMAANRRVEIIILED
jgi:outer membrane protein OmpA-like peptidoglycan-associated protein